MNMFRAPLIAAAVLAMTSCVSYAQVRVIGPDSEHVYSSDPREAGRLLDDEALQRENVRRERAKMEREYQREEARRQEELDAAAARAAAADYEEQPNTEAGILLRWNVWHPAQTTRYLAAAWHHGRRFGQLVAL